VIELLEDVRKSINKSELLRTQAIISLGNTNLRSLLITSQKEPTQKWQHNPIWGMLHH